MYKAYKKIFSGALLIFFDINIGIDILPDIIGFILIITALNDLHKKTERLDFKKAKIILYPLVPLSIYSMFNNLSYEQFAEINHIVLVLSMTFTTLSMYYFYTATMENIREVDLYNEVKSFKNLYVYSHFIAAFILSFSNLRTLPSYLTLVFIVFVLLFILTIVWLFNLRKLKNYFIKDFDE